MYILPALMPPPNPTLFNLNESAKFMLEYERTIKIMVQSIVHVIRMKLQIIQTGFRLEEDEKGIIVLLNMYSQNHTATRR